MRKEHLTLRVLIAMLLYISFSVLSKESNFNSYIHSDIIFEEPKVSFECCIKNYINQYSIKFLELRRDKNHSVTFDETLKEIRVKGYKKSYSNKMINKFFQFTLDDENMTSYRLTNTKYDFLLIKSKISGATQANTLLNTYLLINLLNGDTNYINSLGNQKNSIHYDLKEKSLTFFQYTFSDKFYKKNTISVIVNKIDLLKNSTILLEDFYDSCNCR